MAVGQPGHDLANLPWLAMVALRADGILVVDEHAETPRVAVSEGLVDKELEESLEKLAPLAARNCDGGEDVTVTSCCGLGILSTSVSIIDSHHPIHMHVVYRDNERIPEPSMFRPLTHAFARHIGVALCCRTVDADNYRATAVGTEGVFPWDDLGYLPKGINEITERVANLVQPLTGATTSGIMVWDEEHDILRALPGAFGATDGALTASVTGPITNMFSVCNRVFVTGEPYVSNHANTDPGILQHYVELFGIRNILAVALNHGKRRVGVLHLANKPSDFTSEDIATVKCITSQAGMAVELVQMAARMVERQSQEGILSETAVSIASGQHVEDSLLPAFDKLGAALGASLVGLVPLTSPPLIRRTGPSYSDLEHHLFVGSQERGQTSSGAFPHHPGDPGWAAVHAPVEFGGDRAATLSVVRESGGPFTSKEEDTVTRLANLVALAWAAEAYQHQLAEVARLRERERIADGLHDHVAQIIFAAQLGIDTLLENATDQSYRERMLEVRDLLTNGDTAIRNVIYQLAETPQTNLARRLRLEVESVEQEFGVSVHFEPPDEDALQTVPRTVADAVVKLAREGMANAVKHTWPCRIAVKILVNDADQLTVSVTDDGLPLRHHPDRVEGHGLRSVRTTVEDAGGTYELASPINEFGTQLLATFRLG